MGKYIRVNVQGFGKVLVEKPKKYNRVTFADGVGEAVSGTMNLLQERDRTSFHPVLGKGGYDFNHKTQKAHDDDVSVPGVSYPEPRRLRFAYLWLKHTIFGRRER